LYCFNESEELVKSITSTPSRANSQVSQTTCLPRGRHVLFDA
jgi:hypothetical protein